MGSIGGSDYQTLLEFNVKWVQKKKTQTQNKKITIGSVLINQRNKTTNTINATTIANGLKVVWLDN